ncbi:hypothetical protein F4824DRAFT_478684, partial [Ustulina deusta]
MLQICTTLGLISTAVARLSRLSGRRGAGFFCDDQHGKISVSTGSTICMHTSLESLLYFSSIPPFHQILLSRDSTLKLLYITHRAETDPIARASSIQCVPPNSLVIGR